jgi:signal transduction histidine kinase
MIVRPLQEINTLRVDKYAVVLSERVSAERETLAGRWLERLTGMLVVEENDVFPSDKLLDHIPVLIAEIAAYLRAPADEEIAANAAVIDKARELGVLRHEQRASVHQLIREYELLGELLEGFVMEETERLDLKPTPRACFEVLRRITHATRILMRTTVDTFVSEYTTTIQERNERIRTFNRMASHELRTPLGTLLFAAALLEKDAVQADPHRLARLSSTISSNVERLSRLVTNLERLTRLTETLDVPSQQETNLESLGHEVAQQLEEMAAPRGVAIRIDPSLPALFVDSARLELVLLNLISNAIKYSDPDKSERFVEVGPFDGGVDDGMCAVAIRDNGLGIAAADIDTIFERFVRAHAHLDSSLGVSGTGLGLAIVAECIRELGGSIECQSTLATGTTFVVRLPLKPAGVQSVS